MRIVEKEDKDKEPKKKQLNLTVMVIAAIIMIIILMIGINMRFFLIHWMVLLKCSVIVSFFLFCLVFCVIFQKLRWL